jgi:AraC-like DNA-binding protein
MLFKFGFYSSLLLIFFVHTIVYCAMFMYRHYTQQRVASKWLALFLLLAALYLAPWMLGFAGWYDAQPYRDILFYTPFQQLLLIGPVLFFYVQATFNPSLEIKGKQWWHFVPGLLYNVGCVVAWVYDKWVAKQYVFLASQNDPDFHPIYQLVGFISMMVYLVLSIKYYYAYKAAIEQVLSNAANFLFSWVRNFLIAFLLIQLAWILNAAAGYIFNVSYADVWWYFLGFSIITYYIAIAGHGNMIEAKVFFKSDVFANHQQVLFLQRAPELLAYNHQGNFENIEVATQEPAVANADLQEWKQKIEQLLTAEKMYEQPELSLLQLAKPLGVNIAQLSKYINAGFGLNFNDLVNKYRVMAVIGLLEKGEHKRQTLLSIAYECGFNSKSTFNRAFKKEKGCTPQTYLQRNVL